MLPNNVASTFPMSSIYLAGDGNRVSKLEDFEMGGIAIQDPSQGLSSYLWRCWVEDSNVFLQRDGAAPDLLFIQSGIVDIALGFDQSMRHNVAYELNNGDVGLRWFDSVPSAYVTTVFTGYRNPRLALDDKRIEQIGNSDLIFGYIRAGNLAYRQQRDRFQTERILKTGIQPNIRLKNIGMGTNLRLQFELV